MGSIALDRETLQIVNHLRDAQRVTLVIGAGVSYGRGVPLWGSLAKAVWEEIFGTPYPYVSGGGLEMHPFGHQFALELVERRLRELPSRSSGKEDEFLLTLKRAIYNRVQRPARRTAADTLGVLARLLRGESGKGQGRRVERVITLNVDSLLEDEVHNGQTIDASHPPLVWPISRASDDAMRAPRAIPIYHIHGYLPSPKLARPPSKKKPFYHQLIDPTPDTLVLTDWQYWKLSTTPAGFANRVFSTALHDSHCIFVGLSFTDANLPRWLGMRSVELALDVQSEFGAPNYVSIAKGYRLPHVWIRPTSDDPGGIIGRVMELRGIRCITIDSWQSPQFAKVMKRIFPENQTPIFGAHKSRSKAE